MKVHNTRVRFCYPSFKRWLPGLTKKNTRKSTLFQVIGRGGARVMLKKVRPTVLRPRFHRVTVMLLIWMQTVCIILPQANPEQNTHSLYVHTSKHNPAIITTRIIENQQLSTHRHSPIDGCPHDCITREIDEGRLHQPAKSATSQGN